MKSLHVEIHPTKTISSKKLGKVKNGFDFLGFRTMPLLSSKESATTIQASTESVSRRGSLQRKKVARLYEQGASKKRIGQYPRRWLGWARLTGFTIALTSTFAVHAAPFAPTVDCAGSKGHDSSNYSFLADILTPGGEKLNNIHGSKSPLTVNLDSSNMTGQICITPSLPDSDDTVCENQPFTPTLDTPFYITVTGTAPTTCVFETTIATVAGGSTIIVRNERFMAPTAPTAVPLFTPIGLIATIGGLLWFGRRRKAIKLIK